MSSSTICDAGWSGSGDVVPDQVVTLDSNGQIVSVNPSWCEFARSVGGPPVNHGFIGIDYLRLIAGGIGLGGPAAQAEAEAGLRAVLHGKSERFALSYVQKVRQRDRHFEMSVIGLAGSSPRVVVIHRDVTAVAMAEEQLRLADTAFESHDGIMILDAKRRIIRVNQSFCDLTGYDAEEVIGRKSSFMRSGQHDFAFYRTLWRRIHRAGKWDGEIRTRRKDGEIRLDWLSISEVRNRETQVTHYVVIFTDITKQRKAETELTQLAFYDPLSGLPNRRLFFDRLRQAQSACQRSERHCALLLLDLDHFKSVNDVMGTQTGDQLLQLSGKRLSDCLRDGDTVSRLSGDEFGILLVNLESHRFQAAAQTEVIANKLLAAISRTHEIGGIEATTTASIGIVIFDGRGKTADLLMQQAEMAMYQAKSGGRNTMRFYDVSMQRALHTQMTLATDLRTAAKNNQFFLHYQAQIDDQGRLVGAEALARWRHPERGLVSPAQFIPLAEETGFIVPLGLWVLAEACRQLKRWSENPATEHLSIAVNVSSRQFCRPDFVTQVLVTLQETEANPERLKLELTESLLIENVDTVVEKMTQLQERGIRFSLDDFGTGYSSLAYLKRLPLAQLKIDQCFVADVLTDPNGAAIARTIVSLGQGLNLSVVAEGVETQGQRDFLKANGCTLYQGYLYGKPGPADALLSLVADPSGTPRRSTNSVGSALGMAC